MNQGKKFQKKIEDFVCENCSHKVKGTGFTNHCPQCFYSKHVDENPGDRQASCGGLMQPIASEIKNGQTILVFKCQKCGFKRKNKIQPQDNQENLYKIIKGFSRV